MPRCDICKEEKAIIDGKTVYGPWAFMCERCFHEVGIGLGLGKGQILKKGEE